MGGVQVSVCFGKYENDDGVCWEKWSAFSPNNNKYLEEVGKCSTPGSVAQKKAFFEAHYKKIAAMKKLAAQAEAQAQAQINEKEPAPPVEVEVEVDDKPVPFNSTATDKLEEAALVNAESMKLVQEHFQVDLQLKMDPKKEEEKKKKVASASASKSDWSTRRRSLFMEQMGDKDIVKRVFKTLLPKPEKQIINQRSRKATDKLVNPELVKTDPKGENSCWRTSQRQKEGVNFQCQRQRQRQGVRVENSKHKLKLVNLLVLN